MSTANTSIEWCDRTWSPVRGCSRVSPECDHCYAMKQARRFDFPGGAYEGLTRIGSRGVDWSGVVRLIPGALREPLTWKKPARIFVNSMSDLFHESLTDAAIDQVFAVMGLSQRHTFMVLTKRPARMLAYMTRLAKSITPLETAARALGYTFKFDGVDGTEHSTLPWPIPSVQLGVSVGDQATADARIPLLLQTPASVRFVSYEPALGPVDFSAYIFAPMRCRACGSMSVRYDSNPKGLPPYAARPACLMGATLTGEPGAERCMKCESLDVEHLPTLKQIIVGAESGHGARPFDVAWARSTRDQCMAADVAFFYKQDAVKGKKVPMPLLDGRKWAEFPPSPRRA